MSCPQPARMTRSLLATNRKPSCGFTLIELMIVVVIVAIIAGIAYPMYQDSVRKSRRAEAKTTLSDLAARQEQYFNDNKTYTDNPALLGAPLKPGNLTPQGYYSVQIAPGGTNDLLSSYRITATTAGVQATDTKCATFTLNSTGKKESTPAGNTCW